MARIGEGAFQLDRSGGHVHVVVDESQYSAVDLLRPILRRAVTCSLPCAINFFTSRQLRFRHREGHVNRFYLSDLNQLRRNSPTPRCRGFTIRLPVRPSIGEVNRGVAQLNLGIVDGRIVRRHLRFGAIHRRPIRHHRCPSVSALVFILIHLLFRDDLVVEQFGVAAGFISRIRFRRDVARQICLCLIEQRLIALQIRVRSARAALRAAADPPRRASAPFFTKSPSVKKNVGQLPADCGITVMVEYASTLPTT